MAATSPAGQASARAAGATGRAPRLREATFADHAAIALLESRWGYRPKSYDEWAHLWTANPLHRALGTHWPIGWVLEDGAGRIVASIGNIPLPYELEGRPLLASSGRAWVAEPEFRSAALLLLDHAVQQPGVELYLNTTVNEASTAAVTMLGCARVPVGAWDRAGLWITGYHGVARSWLARRRHPLATPLAYPLAAAALVRDRLARRIPAADDVEVVACPAFDERFDDFWADARRAAPHLLWAVRTREVLEWHYHHALLQGRLWIAAVLDGRRIVAYAVFDRRDNTIIGLKRARLADFQSLDGTTALLPPLLAWGVARCRAEGVHVLECIGRWLEPGEPLDRLAPHRRTLPAWSSYYRAASPGLAATLADRRRWAPTLYDGNASLDATETVGDR